MKLNQKIIHAVNTHMSASPEVSVNPHYLQSEIRKKSGFSPFDFETLVAMNQKYLGLVGLRVLELKAGKRHSFYLKGRTVCVTCKEDRKIFYPTNFDFSTVIEAPSTHNWALRLSAFSTVEDAIATYPETKPAFEKVFGAVL
jgi:hypothetical protein